MSERNDKQQNTPDELTGVKDLIGSADGGGFELDDILAEYGHPRPVPEEDPVEEDPEEDSAPDNVVAFPGGYVPEEEPDVDVAMPEDAPEDRESFDEEPEIVYRRPPAEVIPFPQPKEEDGERDKEEKGALNAFLDSLNRRADRYAEQMYAEDEKLDPEEVRRLEQLIPGTDVEEEPEPVRRVKRAKKVEPPPPDTPPQQLAKEFGRGLKNTRLRLMSMLALTLMAAVQLVVPAAGYVFRYPLGEPMVQSWMAAALMGLGILLGVDAWAGGFVSLFRLRPGMDTLCSLGCLFTLLDGVVLALEGADRLPCTAAALAGLYFLLLGNYHKKCALRLSCRTAAASSSPYRVTLDEEKWNGRDTYSKWSGDAAGFGSQIQQRDGAQRICGLIAPAVLVCAAAFTLYITATRPEQGLWCASCLFTACAALGSSVAYGRSFHLTARRLAHSGAALAGWPGVVGSRKADRVLITDTDLFPPGYVDLNGFKVLGDFPMERVVAYTATMIRDSGSGLTKLFHDYLRTLGGLMRNTENLRFHEGGGLSATIRGDQVLVGSADFMKLMEIDRPEGVSVKNAVFCAINGELAGIFALNYYLPDTVFPALDSLIREKVGPVLATRDFNLIPAMLKQRFKLSADRMDFPPVERRRELSAPDQDHGDTLAALLCREGLFPFAEAVVCAKRLRRATRVGAVLCCVSSVLGLLLTGYLVFVSAYGSLSPLNLLLYLLLWLLPVWLLTAWAHRG